MRFYVMRNHPCNKESCDNADYVGIIADDGQLGELSIELRREDCGCANWQVGWQGRFGCVSPAIPVAHARDLIAPLLLPVPGQMNAYAGVLVPPGLGLYLRQHFPLPEEH